MSPVVKEVVLKILTGELFWDGQIMGSVKNHIGLDKGFLNRNKNHFNAELVEINPPYRMSHTSGHLTPLSFDECLEWVIDIPTTAVESPGFRRSGTFGFKRLEWENHYDHRTLYPRFGLGEYDRTKKMDFNFLAPNGNYLLVPNYLEAGSGSIELHKLRDMNELRDADDLEMLTIIAFYSRFWFGEHILKTPDSRKLVDRYKNWSNKPGLVRLDDLVIQENKYVGPYKNDFYYSAKFSWVPDTGYETIIKTTHPDFYINCVYKQRL